MRTLLLSGAAAYGALMLAACSLESSILFPRHLANQGAPAVASLPPGVEQAWLDTDEGRVEAWFIPGVGRTAASPGPAVMFFHGNGALIDYSMNIAHAYTPLGVSVLLPEYRGYGRSAGSPSQTSIGRDMRAWRAWLASRPEVNASHIIYHGQSLGGGVAGDLMTDHPPAALVLHSTFTSVRAMAGNMLVPGFIVRSQYRTDLALARYTGPVLIMHGDDDRVIPPAHAGELAKLAGNPDRVTLVTGPGDHNDYPSGAQLNREIARFLAASGLVASPSHSDAPGAAPPVSSTP